MQSHTYFIRITIFICLFLLTNEPIFAGRQNISAVRAMQLFDAGNFPEAEKMFKYLLDKEPGNPMLNYYYGASRTENGNFDDKDLNQLLEARKNFSPYRLHYYFAIQYHARNNWEQALKFYNQFRLSVPENEQQELGIASKIQQCFDQINPFVDMVNQKPEKLSVADSAETIYTETTENISVSETQNILIQPEEETEPEQPVFSEEIQIDRRALPDLPGVKTTYELPEGKRIDFRVNSEITYLFDSQFHTEDGKTLFNQGQFLEKELEQKLNETIQLRDEYKKTAIPATRKELGEKILTLENDSYRLQDKINQKFSEARNIENQYWNQAGSIAIYNFQVEQQKIQSVLNGKSIDSEPTTPKTDSISVFPTAVSEFFESKSASDPMQTEKLVYKIQIGAYSRGVPAYKQRLYNKLSLIRKIENYTDENGVVVYTTGNLTNMDDAEIMQNQVKQEGIQDAIVVPYFNGKRITLEQAKKIEAGNDIERN